MPTSSEMRALKLLVERWNAVKAQLDQLHMPQARPDDAYRIFNHIEPKIAGEVGFSVGPVVFNLPERANGRPDLFVVLLGRLHFDELKITNDSKLQIVNFATQVAYFRQKDNDLVHVYGAHYDFALNEIGHPAFHAQMRSYCERYQDVANSFDMTCTPTDRVKDILRNVRLPSAHMDFFSYVLQLSADHLIDRTSGEADLQAFRELKQAAAIVLGAAFRVPQLANTAAQACLKANHWYPL